jgi:hypothetical protein
VGQKEFESSTAGGQAKHEEFTITVEKPADFEGILGLILQFPDKTCCRVTGFKEGYIKKYNDSHQDAPDAQIQVGDTIVDVNGVSGDKDKMMQEMGSQCLVLKVHRFPQVASKDEPVPSPQDEPARREEPTPADESAQAEEPAQADEHARTQEPSPEQEPGHDEAVVETVLVSSAPMTGTDTVDGDVPANPPTSTDGLVDVSPDAEELAPPSKNAQFCSCW